MVARDHGEPQKETTSFVEVTVKRDKGTLRFSTNNYRVTISENKQLNSGIIKLNAQPSVSHMVSMLSRTVTRMSHVTRINHVLLSVNHTVLWINHATLLATISHVQ